MVDSAWVLANVHTVWKRVVYLFNKEDKVIWTLVKREKEIDVESKEKQKRAILSFNIEKL